MSDTHSILPALRIQGRVMHALLMREILTRYGRHNIGFLWLFLEPMLLTIGVTILWHFTFHGHSGSISITAFAVTGYSSVQLWRTTGGRCVSALQANLSLLYHRNIGVLDIFLARIVLEVAGATAAFGTMIILFSSVNLMPAPVDLFPVLAGWALLAWFGGALAITIGAATELSELVDRIWHPVSYLLFPLSGAMFLVDWLPSSVQPLALWIPMLNALEIIRSGYFGNAIVAHYDVIWLITVNVLLTLAGLMLCREVEDRVESE